MGFIDSYKKDAKYRTIYGVSPKGEVSMRLLILEYLIPKLDDGVIKNKLRSLYVKYDKNIKL